MANQQRSENMDKLKPLPGVLAGILLVAAIIAAVVMRITVINPRVEKLFPYHLNQRRGNSRQSAPQALLTEVSRANFAENL